MLVVVADNIPPAVRGRMKLYFVEPRPGIFVSGLNDSLATEVANYLLSYSRNGGMMIFQSLNRAPWFKIHTVGNVKKNIKNFNGLQLVLEKETENTKTRYSVREKL